MAEVKNPAPLIQFPCLPDILDMSGTITFQGGLTASKVYFVFERIQMRGGQQDMRIRLNYSMYVPPVEGDNVTQADQWIPLRSKKFYMHTLTHAQYAALPAQDLPTLLTTIAPALALQETTVADPTTLTYTTVTWLNLEPTLFP